MRTLALKPVEERPQLPITPQQKLLLLDMWQRSGLPARDFAMLSLSLAISTLPGGPFLNHFTPRNAQELREGHKVELQTTGLDFVTASEVLTNGMNEYVNQLVLNGKQMWTQGEIQFTLQKNGFRLRVHGHKWGAQLGGTMKIYFLLAYHYALLKLSADQGSRVPNFLLLDFPATIEGEQVADHENFAIEPFIKLCRKPEYAQVQVIAAGSAFEGFIGAKRIKLDHVWG